MTILYIIAMLPLSGVIMTYAICKWQDLSNREKRVLLETIKNEVVTGLLILLLGVVFVALTLLFGWGLLGILGSIL